MINLDVEHRRTMVFVHLLNDFSGSPRVLRDVIRAFEDKSDCRLYVGHSSSGFLTHCGISTTRYYYRHMQHRLLTLASYLFSQLVLFMRLLFDRSIGPDALIYVNTLLPFGAALYGRLTGRRVVYHIHEVSLSPLPLKWFLIGIARFASSLNIFVSDAHRNALPIAGVKSVRVYDALDSELATKAAASKYQQFNDGFFNILMVASLRDYKGVPEFLALAKAVEQERSIRFHLLLNESPGRISSYMARRLQPRNLILHQSTANVASYYRKAGLVMNLSRVDQCVETFGLTVLEAMAFGIPVIVPPVGGPAELTADGVHGFCVDSRDLNTLRERVLQLMNDRDLCEKMSAACRERAVDFSYKAFAGNIRTALDEIQ
jgi:glycosyltransferase involved in cell wall biosynthesis